jgi:hypothetical protein
LKGKITPVAVLEMIKSDPTLSLDATQYPSLTQVKNAMKRRAVDQNSMGAILEAVECYKIEDISFETEEEGGRWRKRISFGIWELGWREMNIMWGLPVQN